MNCAECDTPLIQTRAWKKMTQEAKDASGAKRAAASDPPACSTCYFRARRAGRPRRTHKLADLVEDTLFILDGGSSVEAAAAQLGVKTSSLIRMFYRAKARGLTDVILKESRSENDQHFPRD